MKRRCSTLLSGFHINREKYFTFSLSMKPALNRVIASQPAAQRFNIRKYFDFHRNTSDQVSYYSVLGRQSHRVINNTGYMFSEVDSSKCTGNFVGNRD